MPERDSPIDDPVAQDLLDGIVSYLPIFERPGYRFGVRGDSPYDQKLSSEAKAFIAKVCELAIHLRRSLRGRARRDQDELVYRMVFNDHELLRTSDLTVLCSAFWQQVRARDRIFGALSIRSWFESPHFLPLLRHMKELHASRGDEARQ
jgi:hypothetical protein